MAFKYKNNTVNNVLYNGHQVETLKYDGHVIWTNGIKIRVRASDTYRIGGVTERVYTAGVNVSVVDWGTNKTPVKFAFFNLEDYKAGRGVEDLYAEDRLREIQPGDTSEVYMSMSTGFGHIPSEEEIKNRLPAYLRVYSDNSSMNIDITRNYKDLEQQHTDYPTPIEYFNKEFQYSFMNNDYQVTAGIGPWTVDTGFSTPKNVTHLQMKWDTFPDDPREKAIIEYKWNDTETTIDNREPLKGDDPRDYFGQQRAVIDPMWGDEAINAIFTDQATGASALNVWLKNKDKTISNERYYRVDPNVPRQEMTITIPKVKGFIDADFEVQLWTRDQLLQDKKVGIRVISKNIFTPRKKDIHLKLEILGIPEETWNITIPRDKAPDENGFLYNEYYYYNDFQIGGWDYNPWVRLSYDTNDEPDGSLKGIVADNWEKLYFPGQIGNTKTYQYNRII